LKQAGGVLDPDFADGEIGILIDLLGSDYKNVAAGAGQQAGETIGITGFAFDIDSPEIVKVIEDRLQFLAEASTTTTFETIEPIIAQGLEQEQTIAQISENIAAKFNETRDFRTDRIARTEVSAISNAGNLEGLKQAGAIQKQWVNFGPEDAACQIGGETVPIGEAFSNGFDSAPTHPNCVCTTIAVFG